MTTDIRDCFARYDTDKDTARTWSRGHSYGATYRRLLEPRRDHASAVLEIGVYGGGSLRAWRDFFTVADVIGMDIDPSTMIEDEERITTVLGDQTKPSDLWLVGRTWGPFDLIVDDGCHELRAQLISLLELWQHLIPGGLYVIEDVMRLDVLAALPDAEVYEGSACEYDNLVILRRP